MASKPCLAPGFGVLGGDVGARLGGDRAEFVFERPRRPGLAADRDADRQRRRRRVGVEGPALDPHVAGLGAGQVEPADRVVLAGRQGGGADRRSVDVVVVDVDRRAAVGLVVAAAVLVDALVPGPGVGGDVGGAAVRLAVPVGDPEAVGLGVIAADLVDQIGDAGSAAAVDAGDVAERVQLLGPGFEEGEGRGDGAGGPAVGLHVEVDRAARPHRHRVRLVDGVDAAAAPCEVAWVEVSLAQLLQLLVGACRPT